MQPVNLDNIAAIVTGPKGAAGDVSAAQLQAAIDALKGGVDPAGDTLAELYALILARATLDQVAAFSVSPTVPTLAPGNNSGKAANSAFVHQEVVNAVGSLQPLDALLTAIAALVTSSDRLMYFTGTDAVAQTPLTSFMRTLLDDGDAATALATLTAQGIAAKGTANGYAGLDGSGKVPTSQLPASVVGDVQYQTIWNANTNSPAIPAASSANKGQYYVVATAGSTSIDGVNDWKVGDWLVSNGTTWDKIDNTDSVNSVAGLVGAISAAALKMALAIALADITDASANGRSLVAAANYAAMRTLLSLGNVDNTSDATKNAAAAALINKTNVVSAALTVNGPAALATDGSNVTVGPSGTAGVNATMVLDGSSAAGVGARVKFSKNLTGAGWFLGHVSSIEGSGSSNDLEYFNVATSARTMRLSATDDSVAFASAVSGSSTTAASLTAKSMGLTENLYAGGLLNIAGKFQTQRGTLAVVNGLNSNLALPANAIVRLTGPSAVFSIGGFTGGVEGDRRTIYNTVAFAMTIKNEDASSTAGNRIKTLTGADVTLRAGTSVATFSYDATDSRWVLESYDTDVAGLVGAISAAALKAALAIALADITDASANGRSLVAAANYAAMRTLLSLGTAATKGTGTSVADAGAGNLEALLPIQTAAAASKAFGAADLFMETRRSNAGSAMADSFPASSTTGLVNGTKLVVTNVDATASVTITAGSGTTISGTGIVGPGRTIQYVYDLPNTIWRPTLNTGTALLAANNLSELASAATARSNLGLGNVDNTSDATKNAAAAALTNKTNVVSAALTVNGPAALATDGSNVTVGPSGTAGVNATMVLDGSSAAGVGARVKFSKNLTGAGWFLGHVSSIEGSGSSNDLEYFNVATSARTMRLSATDDSVAFASAVSGSSTTAASLTAKSMGLTENLYAGGLLNIAGKFQTQRGTLAVVNGLNSNLALPANAIVRLTGPSAVFSIGGFTGGVEGDRRTIYNTVAFAMTIKNEDASSTAGNRIKTLTGADVTLRAGTSVATFSYDATDSRWILESNN